jgi:conjugative transfer signal peptidase TraF
VALAAAAVVATVAGALVAGCRWNFTPSMAVGPYCPARGSVQVGSVVAGCLPRAVERTGLERGYLGAGTCPGGGWPVVKRVAGLAGARYRVTSAGISVDNRWVGRAPPSRDHAGRPLVYARSGTVPKGAVLLLGDTADSWDSRYYGPVPMTGMRPMRALLSK